MQRIQFWSASRLAGAAASRRGTLALLALSGIFYWASLFIYVPTLGVYARSFGLSATLVGTILSMYGMWQALSRLPLGILADWSGRRKPYILAGFILSAVGALIMAFADDGAGLLVGRAITGLAGSAWVPMVVLFSSLFPPEQAVRASAILAVANSFSRLVATAVTGVLNDSFGYQAAFIAAAVGAGLALLATLPVREAALAPKQPSMKQIARLGLRRDVLVPTALNTVAQYIAWATTFGCLPIMARENLGASSAMISLLTSLNVFLSIAGNLVTPHIAQRFNKLHLIYATFAVLVAGTALTALSGSIGMLFLAQAVLGLGSGVNYPLLVGMSIEKVDESERATAMGLHQSVYSVGIFTGPWLSGILSDAFGMPAMFAVTAVGCALAVFGLGLLIGARRGQPGPPA